MILFDITRPTYYQRLFEEDTCMSPESDIICQLSTGTIMSQYVTCIKRHDTRMRLSRMGGSIMTLPEKTSGNNHSNDEFIDCIMSCEVEEWDVKQEILRP